MARLGWARASLSDLGISSWTRCRRNIRWRGILEVLRFRHNTSIWNRIHTGNGTGRRRNLKTVICNYNTTKSKNKKTQKKKKEKKMGVRFTSGGGKLFFCGPIVVASFRNLDSKDASHPWATIKNTNTANNDPMAFRFILFFRFYYFQRIITLKFWDHIEIIWWVGCLLPFVEYNELRMSKSMW